MICGVTDGTHISYGEIYRRWDVHRPSRHQVGWKATHEGRVVEADNRELLNRAIDLAIAEGSR